MSQQPEHLPLDCRPLAELLVEASELPLEIQDERYRDAAELIQEESGRKIAEDLHRFTLDSLAIAEEKFESQQKSELKDQRQSLREVAIEYVSQGLADLLNLSSDDEVIAPRASSESLESPQGLKKRKKRTGFARSLRKTRIEARASTAKIDSSSAEAEGWGDLYLESGVLRPEMHTHGDGLVDIHLSTKQRRKEFGFNGDAQIKYRILDRGGKIVRFTGMDSPKDLRGGIGLKLYDYFRKTIQEKGMVFDGTDVIRKPFIAHTLKQVGLSPENSNIVAEILPQEMWVDPDVPAVVIRKGAELEKEQRSTQKSGKRLFYQVVDDSGLPVRVDRLVPLHTRWVEQSDNR